MKAYGITDIGLHRGENQDNFAAVENGRYTIAVVCDGMGGATAGKTASTLGVETFVKTLLPLLRDDATPMQLREMASFSVAQANTVIHQYAKENPGCQGMGTTLVSAVANESEAIVCNVGDSRAYLVRSNAISRITHDHSVVETMVENGDITSEQARTHPNRNLITRALGPENMIPCDTYEVALERGDLLLLCSDGLVITASDSDILRAIQEGNTCEESLNRLVKLAKKNGAPDNVTALLIENK